MEKLKGKYPMKIKASFTVELVDGKPKITGSNIGYTVKAIKIIKKQFEEDEIVKEDKDVMMNNYWDDFRDWELILDWCKEWSEA